MNSSSVASLTGFLEEFFSGQKPFQDRQLVARVALEDEGLAVAEKGHRRECGDAIALGQIGLVRGDQRDALLHGVVVDVFQIVQHVLAGLVAVTGATLKTVRRRWIEKKRNETQRKKGDETTH